MSEPTPTVHDGADVCGETESVTNDQSGETKNFVCELPPGHEGPHQMDNVTWD